MAKKRKKTGASGDAFSPKRYLKEKARTFPIDSCLINESWQESGLAQVIVIRQQPSGKFLYAVFMIDVFCLGLKNAMWNINQTDDEIEELVQGFEFHDSPMKEFDYDFAHNLVYGAIAYAEDLGFPPHKDFQLARYVLEEDDDNIPEIDIEFGKNGRPLFLAGPYDPVERICRTLDRSVGPGNYEFMARP